MILDLTDIESGWREGAPLIDQETNMAIRAAASVPVDYTFLVVGGYLLGENDSSESDRIYEYDSISDGWILLPSRLVEPASYIKAFLLPEDYFPCGEA